MSLVVPLAWLALAVSAICALALAVDLLNGQAQKMWIMDLVWPLTALWAGPAGLWFYFRYGRQGSSRAMRAAKEAGRPMPSRQQPFPALVAKGTLHCGAGCTLADVLAESFAVVVPLTVFGHRIFGSWIYDYILALSLGIAFQYFTIMPMRKLSRKDGLVQAAKADFLSLTAWQVGMYGWMAIATFALFDRELPKGGPVFWFMMQVGMFLGFATAYPMNWWLLRRGIKERM